ncbi:hypothetical protein HDU97_006239 [Phlyctochytrium planicorne]|nr:hypothetical protein HDU97_006239 [Phlyctochytrium planicorne]
MEDLGGGVGDRSIDGGAKRSGPSEQDKTQDEATRETTPPSDTDQRPDTTSTDSLESEDSSPYVSPLRTVPTSATASRTFFDRRASSLIKRRDTSFALASSRPSSRNSSRPHTQPDEATAVIAENETADPFPDGPDPNSGSGSKPGTAFTIQLPANVVDVDELGKSTYMPSAAWNDGFMKQLDDKLFVKREEKRAITFSMILRGEGAESDDSEDEKDKIDNEVSEDEVVNGMDGVGNFAGVAVDQHSAVGGQPTVNVAVETLVEAPQTNVEVVAPAETAEPGKPPSDESQIGAEPGSSLLLPMVNAPPIAHEHPPEQPQATEEESPDIPIFMVTDVDGGGVVVAAKVDGEEKAPSQPEKKPVVTLIKPVASSLEDFSVLVQGTEKYHESLRDYDFFAPSHIMRSEAAYKALLNQECLLESELKEKKENLEGIRSNSQLAIDETKLFKWHTLQVQKAIVELLNDNISLLHVIATCGGVSLDIADTVNSSAMHCKQYASTIVPSPNQPEQSLPSTRHGSAAASSQRAHLASQMINLSGILVTSLTSTSLQKANVGSTMSMMDSQNLVGDDRKRKVKSRGQSRKGRASSVYRGGGLAAPVEKNSTIGSTTGMGGLFVPQTNVKRRGSEIVILDPLGSVNSTSKMHLMGSSERMGTGGSGGGNTKGLFPLFESGPKKALGSSKGSFLTLALPPAVPVADGGGGAGLGAGLSNSGLGPKMGGSRMNLATVSLLGEMKGGMGGSILSLDRRTGGSKMNLAALS